MAALRQIAFYGKGGTGKPKRKAQPVTAPIEDRSLGSPSKNEMHFHSRMKVMASMRGGDGFRVPPAASRKARAVSAKPITPRPISARAVVVSPSGNPKASN
ncbi:hypothetical protein [Sinorhizobium meliloti]|nr:hypothetical protein [Sinorhizobium meliloti]MBP2470883.1 hypothetical protein [Sinorhizobium meliloti]MDE4550664.1 hypothetical protein [Sinorhizobium meliloti]MDE4563119.1 hypothetical protein [Sinorhizobium meliloti SM11]MDE4597912.1 hypothetical protein [Sinorhizobium meliloti]GEC39029.1 hypothetical protein EME01_31010 [Sinorhizobium meliloti]